MRVEPYVLECSGIPDGSVVLAFEGVEEISTTYRYEIDLLVAPDADVSNAIGKPATLIVNTTAGGGTRVHGVVATAGIAENLEEHDLYRVVLVPRVRDVLGLDRHSRVFVRESVRSIVEMLLADAGFLPDDYEFRLLKDYKPIEFVCQYRESTLDFLMRLLEREGIYFYFTQGASKEKLVILDDKGQHPPDATTVIYRRTGAYADTDWVRRFRAERRATPGSVRVDGENYLNPALFVTGEARVEGGNHGELRVRGANVATPRDAQRVAQLRAEELRARQQIFRGEGRAPALRAGQLFTLNEHPRSGFDGSYLVTKLRVRGRAAELAKQVEAFVARGEEEGTGEVFRTELEAIRGETQFRPELRAPIPRVHGMEGGVIEGDSTSDYAQLDEHGRYYVKLKFDERPGRGAQASARIRMMQPHAGSPEGMHFPLRAGTEVMVSFVGGDPDRPVIAGAVPNGQNPAVVRADNTTKNVLWTGSNNRIVMEDMQGSEYVHIRTPHKNSYIHIGATFNPQYNVVKNTDGTSLTYTTQLATSYTGDDTETVAERARVTVIGRMEMMSGDQTAANEVGLLLGDTFIQAMETDIQTDLLVWINSDVAALAKDVSTANTDAGKATTLANWSTISVVLQGPTDAYLQTTCVQFDLEGKPTIPTPTTYPQTPNGLQDALQQWLTLNPTDTKAQQVQTDANTVAGDLTSAIAAVNAVVTAAVDPPVSALTAPAVAAIKKLQTDTTTLETDADKMQQATTSAMPGSPSPNVLPTYINVTRTLPDQVLPTVTAVVDTTALDILDQNAYQGVTIPATPVPVPVTFQPANPPYKFAAGSDLKVVGGDNMTLTANDSRSQTQGHSYGLVQGGQTSVVYSPDKYLGAVNWQFTAGAQAQLQGEQTAQQNAQNALDEAQTTLDDFQSQVGPLTIQPQTDNGDGTLTGPTPDEQIDAYQTLILQFVNGAVSNLKYQPNQAAFQQAVSDVQAQTNQEPPYPQQQYDSSTGEYDYDPDQVQQWDDTVEQLLGTAYQNALQDYTNNANTAQTNLTTAQTNLEEALAALPIRPPVNLPWPWTPTSVAASSNVYGNSRSWLEGMSRTTITHGVHSVVYSPAQAPQATPSQTQPTVPTAGTGSTGTQFTQWVRPAWGDSGTAQTPPAQGWSVPVTSVPAQAIAPPSTVAQASELWGDQYSYVDGSQFTAIGHDKTSVVGGHVSSAIWSGQDSTIHGNQTSTVTGDHTTQVNGDNSSTVNGHAHSFIGGGQDSTVHGGQSVTITGGKTSTVVGVNFSGTAPLNISADVLKLAMAVASVNITLASMNVFDVHLNAGIFTTTQTMFTVKNGAVETGAILANILTCGLYSVL
jgi:type VI secretion system secreted protein VgrG